ncbi:MAG: DUF4115 domain-containing protein [Desulfovibrio sp.]|jgi:cytoskeleton protein RodZ
MTYAELGEVLRAEREKRRLSIDDAANELKINVRQLQALEEGNVGLLPHQAYAKGFIRSYASWLGISHEEIQRALASLGVPEKAPQKIVSNEKDGAPSKTRNSYFIPVLILLLALGLYVGWENGALDYLEKLNISNFGNTPALQSAEEFISSKAETNNKLRSEKQVLSKNTETNTNREDSEKLNASQNQPVERKEQTTAVIQQDFSSQDVSSNEKVKIEKTRDEDISGKPSETTTVPGQNKLVITATEECWIHSNADKTDTRQFSLRKGDTFALTFAKSLELKLGNAGGVRLRYNGKDLPPPGTSGQVKVLTFPPSAS